MNERQSLAYGAPVSNPFATDRRKFQRYVKLPGLLLSTVVTVDDCPAGFLWHASVAIVEAGTLQPISARKLSAANKLRVKEQLRLLLEGVGGEDARESESFGSFHLFRRLTVAETEGLKEVKL